MALLDEDRLDPCKKFRKIKDTAEMSEVLLLHEELQVAARICFMFFRL